MVSCRRFLHNHRKAIILNFRNCGFQLLTLDIKLVKMFEIVAQGATKY